MGDVLSYPGGDNHKPASTTAGGGPTSGDMDIVDAKIAAAEARTDTKFAELLGELKAIDKSTSGLKPTIIGTGIAVLAIVIGILAWGNQVFNTGMDAQGIVEKAIEAVGPKIDGLDVQYTDLNAKVDTVIEFLRANQDPGARSLPDTSHPVPMPMPEIEQ